MWTEYETGWDLGPWTLLQCLHLEQQNTIKNKELKIVLQLGQIMDNKIHKDLLKSQEQKQGVGEQKQDTYVPYTGHHQRGQRPPRHPLAQLALSLDTSMLTPHKGTSLSPTLGEGVSKGTCLFSLTAHCSQGLSKALPGFLVLLLSTVD